MIIKEEWREIPGVDGYQVSNLGRVRSITRVKTVEGAGKSLVYPGRILSQALRDGYPRVNLHGKAYTVHRLVAAAFLGPCPEGMEVRHLDGNKVNNRAENLAYGTHRENVLDQYNTRGFMPKGLTKAEAVDIAARIRRGDNNKKIAAETGVSRETIYRMRSGNSYGWAFEIVDAMSA